MADFPLPPSLAVKPNIPFESQSLGSLVLERAYWARSLATAPGFASAKAADDFRRGCEAWIHRRFQEASHG